jgi:DNA-binding CsgD family transcriptional regulator
MKKRRNGKAQILLWIYERLLTERKIAKGDILEKEHISAITFKRYLYDIKDYLDINNSDYVLVYARRYKLYRLIRRNGVPNVPSLEPTVGSPKIA